MRAILFVLMLLVVAVIAAVASGYVDINQTRPAQAPQVSAQKQGVTASGGQTPAFDVATGSVKVEVQDKQVKVPTLVVEPANQAAQTNSN
jgi:hypothetical protein